MPTKKERASELRLSNGGFICTHGAYDNIDIENKNMKHKVIKTAQEYQLALKRLEVIFDV